MNARGITIQQPYTFSNHHAYDYHHILEEPTVSTTQVLYPVSGWVPAGLVLDHEKESTQSAEPSWIPYHPCGHRQNVLAGMLLYAVALNAPTNNWRVMEGTKVTSAMANPVIMGSECI